MERVPFVTNFRMESQQRPCLLLVGLTELHRRLKMAVHASLASASSSSSMSTASPAKNSNPTSPTACELPCVEPPRSRFSSRPPAASCGKSTCLAHFALTAAALAQTRSVSGEHLGQACRELLCWTERDRGAAGCSETGGSEGLAEGAKRPKLGPRCRGRHRSRALVRPCGPAAGGAGCQTGVHRHGRPG